MGKSPWRRMAASCPAKAAWACSSCWGGWWRDAAAGVDGADVGAGADDIAGVGQYQAAPCGQVGQCGADAARPRCRAGAALVAFNAGIALKAGDGHRFRAGFRGLECQFTRPRLDHLVPAVAGGSFGAVFAPLPDDHVHLWLMHGYGAPGRFNPAWADSNRAAGHRPGRRHSRHRHGASRRWPGR